MSVEKTIEGEAEIMDTNKFRDILIAKAHEMNIANLTDAEIERVFTGCVSPLRCMEGFKAFVSNGLSIQDIYPKPQMRLF